MQTRNEWIQLNATKDNKWVCYICGIRLNIENLTLDHKLARSRRPDLRYDHSNLAPCCFACNTRKGSKNLDEL